MDKTITIDGIEHRVTNTLSSGPGEAPHTYELTYGSYVYQIGGVWYMQCPGQCAAAVTIEVTNR